MTQQDELIRELRTELATVNAKVRELIAQGQADHCAMHAALGWGGEWPKDLPAPWRAVTEIIAQRDVALENQCAHTGYELDLMWDCVRALDRVKELESAVGGLSPQLLRAASLPSYARIIEEVLKPTPSSWKKLQLPVDVPMRDWVIGVRDDVLAPLSQQEGKLAIAATCYGEATVKLLQEEPWAPGNSHPTHEFMKKCGACGAPRSDFKSVNTPLKES